MLSLPKIGTYSKPDPEKIALLHPDLVIIHRDARALAERLAAIRIPTATITVGSLDQVFTMVSDIANSTGVRARGEALNARMRKRLDELRADANGRPKPSVIVLSLDCDPTGRLRYGARNSATGMFSASA